MARPTFRRCWTKILPDGSIQPQFGPDGKDHGCGEYTGPVAQILFNPISQDLSDKIKALGGLSEPSELRQLVFDIPPGSPVEFCRKGSLRLDLIKSCGFCGAKFDLELSECPFCLARVEWYCVDCDKLVDNPIIQFIAQRADSGEHRKIDIPLHLHRWAWKIIPQIRGFVLKGAQFRCPTCEAKGSPVGLKPIPCIREVNDERLYTHYVLVIGNSRHLILDFKVNR